MEQFIIRNRSELQRRERDRVLQTLEQVIPNADFREVGSTAVMGVIGKEDIDIAVLVGIEEFEEVRGRLDGCFRRDERQMSSEIYQGYSASNEYDVSIQLTVKAGPHDVFDAFAEVLRENPEVRQAYNALKRQWDGRSMDDYRQAKSAFISGVISGGA